MSDQDFFFDEDEQVEKAPAEKPARSSSSSKPAARQAAAPSAQSVTMTVAALIGVVALLIGVIIGILIPAGASTAPAPTATGGTNMSAPQLTDDQLQSGELPEGHPDLDSMGGGEMPPADMGSGETTPTE